MGVALAIGGGLSAAGSVASGILGSNAAGKAAGQQATADQNALNFGQQVFSTTQQNQAPYLSAGTTSLGQLMQLIGNGTFGKSPAVPSTYALPTLQQVQQTPGYQFTAQQGTKGVLEAAGAAGGAISGGTLKAADAFNTGLADSTYNSQVANGLSAYTANLNQYQAQLQAQQQAYNQLFAPAQLGEAATQNVAQTGTQATQTLGQLMQGIGNANAAGTVGSTNAITGAIGSATGAAQQDLLLGSILPMLKSSLPGGSPIPATAGGNGSPFGSSVNYGDPLQYGAGPG